MAMLDWRCDPDFIIRVHRQEFASGRRRSRGTHLGDFKLRRQEKVLSLCDSLDLWEWKIPVIDMEFRTEVTCVEDEGVTNRAALASFERAELALTSLGLTLSEGKALLHDLQDSMVERQATDYLERHRSCRRFGRRYRSKETGQRNRSPMDQRHAASRSSRPGTGSRDAGSGS